MAKCSSWGLSMSSSVKNVGSSRIFLYSWNKDYHDTSRGFFSPVPFHCKAVRKFLVLVFYTQRLHQKVICKVSG